MNTGSVSFSAKTSGLEIEELSVDSDHPQVCSIACLIDEDGVVEITANLIDVYAEDWPDPTIVEEIHQFIDVLSFEFDSPIRSVRGTGYSLKKNDGSGLSQMVASFTALWDIAADASITPGNKAIIRFRQRFKDLRQSSSMRLYSSAMQQEDPIARFMFLYNIILTMSGDKQATVDKNILAVVADTLTTTSPIKQTTKETVYTRLRNEIAHNRVGAKFSGTSKEVCSCVSGLAKIVKELILIKG